MNRIPFHCGPNQLHQEFNRLVAPMIGKRQLPHRQTRDLRLPRLLSEQVELKIN